MATSRKNNSEGKKGTESRSTRRKPGSGGQGDYYHVEVRPRSDFVKFRTQDVGDPGHIQRVAGQRETGSWGTVKWLISKEDAHVSGDSLVGDTKDAKDLIKKLGSKPVLKSGDRFEAKPTRKAATKSRTTGAQKKTGSRTRSSK